MDLSAHWNILQKMQLLYSTSRDSGGGAIPPLLKSEGASPCCPPPSVATPLIWGETTDLHGHENVQFYFYEFLLNEGG